MTLATEAPDTLAPLEPALVDLLLEVAIGVHRFGMYPPGHPTIEALGDRLAKRLNLYVAEEGPLQVGVASKQLVVGSGATDSGHPILRELARKLRERGVGALTFHQGVQGSHLETLLQALAADASASAETPTVPGEVVLVHPVGYDALDLAAAGASSATSRATDLWLGLARAAMSAGTIEQADAENVEGLACRIRDLSDEPGYDQILLGYMSQLAGVLKAAGGGEEGRAIRSQFSSLLERLDEATIQSLLANAANGEGLRFALDVCEALDPKAAIRIIELAPRGAGQRMSDQLLRLLRKLAVQADVGSDPLSASSDEAFKEAVGRLADDWDLKDPAPEQYSAILDGMVASSAVSGNRKATDRVGGDQRMVYTALEVDALGPAVTDAVERLSNSGGIKFLLRLLESVPEGSRVGEYIREVVHSPEQIKRLTSGVEVDEAALDRVIRRMGQASIEPLLDGLMLSESRSVRRVISDRLSKMGDPVARVALDRLKSEDVWYRVRNLLILAAQVTDLPEDAEVARFLDHVDHRVRREALPLCLRQTEQRSAVLRQSLKDEDPRMVRMALVELKESCPPELVSDLSEMAVVGGDLGAQAAKAIGACSSHLGLKALLDLTRTRGWTGRVRLAKNSPVLLASLEALQTRWPEFEEVVELLNLARKSKNADVRRAVGGSHG